MKKLFLLSMIVLAAFFMSSNVNAQSSYGLCVGLSKCGIDGHDELNAIAPQNDAVSFKKVLAKQGYKVGAVTNKHANRQNILKRLRSLASAPKSSNDKIVFFMATHGSEDGYLLTYGGEAITYSEIIDILSTSKTKHIYCFIMACNSGTVANSMQSDPNWSNNANKWGITFMTSSRPDETSKSFLASHWKHSLFGQALIKGMRGQADTDGDRKITLMELFKFTYNEVSGRMNGSPEFNGETQHPQLIGPKSEHNTVLARW